MTLALLFPGQGSQYAGMGRDLASRYPEARETFEEADGVLGASLSRLMARGPEDELTLTRNAQPAILTHSVAVLRVLGSRLEAATMAAGHSLGEFSAHVAAGTLAFRDALEAVRLRGELMFRAGQARPGTMAALLGLDDDVVRDVCARVRAGICVPANFNAPGQVVVSGDVAGVEEAMELARAAGARRVVPLNVSGAFHSPLMEPAAEGLRQKFDEVDFADPRIPIFSNVTAQPVTQGNEARELLVRQLTSPVRWSASVRAMLDAGADRFVEVGPGSVLCGLSRRNARRVPCTAVGEADEVEALEVPEPR